MVTVVGLGALALGVSCAALGAFGAYQFAHKLEGRVTYLVLAAPLIAVTAALIPPIADATWRGGHPLEALLWWAILAPAAAVVFFSAAERVHVAKAGAQAERSALRGVAVRAQAALTKSEAELAKSRADGNAARALKQCGPVCRTKIAAEAAATADVNAARRELLLAEKTATSGTDVAAPSVARSDRLHGDLDCPLRVPFRAGSQACSGQGSGCREAQAKASSCGGASRSSVPARGERQHQRRSIQRSLPAKCLGSLMGLRASSTGDVVGLTMPVRSFHSKKGLCYMLDFFVSGLMFHLAGLAISGAVVLVVLLLTRGR